MKKTICDRCKKEIIREPSQQMTIDEAIEKEKRLAVSYCDLATAYHGIENIYSSEEERWRQKAEYHAQIAKWLSELYVYRNADKVYKESEE